MKEFTCCYNFATKKEVDIVKNDREKLMQMIKQVDYVVCPKKRLAYTNPSQLSVVEMFKDKALETSKNPERQALADTAVNYFNDMSIKTKPTSEASDLSGFSQNELEQLEELLLKNK